MKIGDDEFVCPVCSGAIPDDDHRGEYPGAFSRFDNETEICSMCGHLEAIIQISGRDMDEYRSFWYIDFLTTLMNSRTLEEVHETLKRHLSYEP